MSTPLSDDQREIIPRWRDLSTTLANGEATPPSRRAEQLPKDFLRDKQIDWLRERTLPYANEVLGAAVVLDRAEEARDAALFILASRSQATKAALHLAEKTVSPLSLQVNASWTLHEAIHATRTVTKNFPFNAFSWAELARLYAMVGLLDRATRAMDVALSLGPENRYILRSSARLYAHQGDHERANRVLRKSESTRTDPWLLSAEIATASLAEKSPKFVKIGRQVLESGHFSPFDISELASALGTLDAKAADLRRARRLFRMALERPNENVLAQARWAATHAIIAVEPSTLQNAMSFEARAWNDYYNGDWSNSLSAGKLWLKDQSFSVKPAIHASYIAAVALEDHFEALLVLDDGLLANPTDPSLLNNRVYSLTMLGRLNEAEATLKILAKLPVERVARIKPSFLATSGLVAFRKGHPHIGRELYTAAIESALQSGNKQVAAKAALFFAIEAIRADGSDSVPLERAIKLSRDFNTLDFKLLKNRAEGSWRARKE